MRQYLDALQQVRDSGVKKGDRTGTGTTEVFGMQARYDLADGFPAVTTKKLYFNSVAHELLWFLKGTGNIEYLAQNGVHIWDEWPYKNYLEKTGQSIPEINGEEWRAGMKTFIGKIATDHAFAEEWGDLGPVYGVQWRKWPDGKGGTIDQIQNAIDTIQSNPTSRRNIVSAWNVAEIDDIARAGGLPPCHTMFQFNVRPGENGEKDKLDLALTQRSRPRMVVVVTPASRSTFQWWDRVDLCRGNFFSTKPQLTEPSSSRIAMSCKRTGSASACRTGSSSMSLSAGCGSGA